MPRRPGGRPVRLSPEDFERTAEALVDVLPVATFEVSEEPTDAREMLRPLGETWRERITRGALAISGTSDKKSRAYLSARRRLERYVTESGRERRRPRPLDLRALVKKIRRPHLDVRAELDLTVCADVVYVGQHKCPMPSSPPQRIRAETLAPVRRALREGDETAAALALLGAFVFEYGLNVEPDARGVIGNISEIRVELR